MELGKFALVRCSRIGGPWLREKRGRKNHKRITMITAEEEMREADEGQRNFQISIHAGQTFEKSDADQRGTWKREIRERTT